MVMDKVKDILTYIIGEYTYKYDTDGNMIGGLTGLDMEWIISAMFFCILIIVVLKIFTGIIKEVL